MSHRITRRPLAALPILAALAAAPAARAQYAAAASKLNPSILAVNNSISAAYTGTSVYYIEPDNGQIGSGYYDSEKGNIKGGRFGFSFELPDGALVQAQYSGAEGELNYDGFLIGGPPYVPAEGTTRYTLQQLDVRLGWGIPVGDKWSLTPYLSGGRRYWVRDLGLGTSGNYNETYAFSYIGLGNLVQYSPAKRWVLTADAMFAKMFDAEINTPPELNETTLGTGPVIRVGAEADYQLYKGLHAFLGAEYLYFNFWQSGVQASGYLEPISRTETYTGTAGLRYSFKGI